MFISSSLSEINQGRQNSREEEIALYDGGDPKIAANLFEQFIKNNIDGALEKQKNDIGNGIQQRIEKIGREYGNAANMWQQMAQQCSQMLEQQKTAQVQGQEQAQKDLTAAREVCAITSQANARNCSQDSLNKLTETFEELSVGLKNDDNYLAIQKFKAQCQGSYGEQDEDDYLLRNAEIAKLCELDNVTKASLPEYNFNDSYSSDLDLDIESTDKTKIKSECEEIRQKFHQRIQRLRPDGSEVGCVAISGSTTNEVNCSDDLPPGDYKRDEYRDDVIKRNSKRAIRKLVQAKLRLENQKEFGEIDIPFCGAVDESSGPDTSPSSGFSIDDLLDNDNSNTLE